MTKLLSLLTMCLISATMNARTIIGRVINDADSCALPGAVCTVSTDEGSRIASGTTDGNGAFALSTHHTTPLSVKVSMVGYSPTVIKIKSGKGDVDLGDIYLSEGIALEGVTVTAAQRVESRGRTLVYPAKSLVDASATSLSLFQKLVLPGLAADPVNRTLSVDGGTPVILINGIPATMNDINALLPKDIERVEYSRITPPRYAASGHTGLINITLRKRAEGGQIYAYARSAVATGFGDGSLSSSYHQQKSQFTLTYTPSWRNYQKVYDTKEESLIAPDFAVKLSSDDRAPFHYLSNNLRLKYDYSSNTGTLFSATLSNGFFDDARRSIGHTSDSALGEYDFRNRNSSHSYTPSLDLYFRRDFNAANSLEAQVVTTLSSDKYTQQNLYIYPTDTSQPYDTDIASHRRSLISAINYVHNFADATSLTIGYQSTLSHSENSYLNTPNKPILTENHNYVYAALSRQINKVYVNLSSGLKAFWTRNDLTHRNFIRNLSSANLTWTPLSSLAFRVMLNYTPSIPSLTQLTDYPRQVSPYLVTNGNPNLRVSEMATGVFTASYTGRKLTFDYQMGYAKTWHPRLSDVSYLGNRLFLSQTINGRHSTVLQHYFGLGLADFHGFGANLSATVISYNNIAPLWSYRLTTFEANINLWYTLNKFTISYWRKFPGKYVSGYYVGRNENGDDLTIDYRPSKHLTLTASWMYMFDSQGTRYPQWSHSPVNPSYTYRHIADNANMVVLSLRYTTNFGTLFRTTPRTLNNADSSTSIMK